MIPVRVELGFRTGGRKGGIMGSLFSRTFILHCFVFLDGIENLREEKGKAGLLCESQCGMGYGKG